jgi:hypothetical protein
LENQGTFDRLARLKQGADLQELLTEATQAQAPAQVAATE